MSLGRSSGEGEGNIASRPELSGRNWSDDGPHKSSSSAETDFMSELKALVADALQKNGALAKIKAELRASVFAVLQDVEGGDSTQPVEGRGHRFSSQEEAIAVGIVKEFLAHYNLDCTLSVLIPEANQSTSHGSKHDMAKELGLNHSKKPLLLQLIESRVHNTSSFERPAQLPSTISLTVTTSSLSKTFGALSVKSQEDPEDETETENVTSERTISRSTTIDGLDLMESL
ncbi:hypothetical protein BC830DRAFT_1136917 [Chytriomyces sp. MP71]|nr:hypothetical protein BC830DRAFT_1136917 [Chytriomyces sp. MP71]